MLETMGHQGGLGLRRFLGRRMARKVGRASLSREAPVDVQRQRMDHAGDRLPPPKGVHIDRISYAGLQALRFTPVKPAPGAILYLHGGGYSRGSAQSHKPLVARLSTLLNMSAISVDYRLAPEHQCPAAVEDGAAALAEICAEADGPVLLAGDSAGGGLALSSVIRQRQAGGVMPAALYLISPWTDLSLSGASVKARAGADPMLTPGNLKAGADLYLGQLDSRDPEASPLFADLAGLPPVFIQVGEDEVLLDDAVRLHDALEAAGVETRCEVWQAMWHDFQLFAPLISEADAALARARDWLAPHLAADQA
ncbi:alpha/beta hydrolase [Alkalicaulis satelles]|uniref:Alpha/beta hydrolase n=1 Tax=Alkalicaulis satelles TaxID=2609175 RepID=A0A5M6ZF35_9PROT|nr:alpha/beta hydrolase [Alkalicaulis satelles]KAA5803339.1 alpha/beta hydrolase [Alkalicaulis satelles]